MLLSLAGVSGVGKSYYTSLIEKELGFTRIHILTTRGLRTRGGEAKGDKVHVSRDELSTLRDAGKLAFEFELLGNSYAYLEEDLQVENGVFEIHYNVIPQFRQVHPELKVIYLYPESLEKSQECVRQRMLPAEVEAARLAEASQHLQRVKSDAQLRKMFDCELYNFYDHKSETALLEAVKTLLEAQK